MASVPENLGAVDVGDIISKVIDTGEKIFTSTQETERAKIDAETARLTTGSSGGFDIGPYVPWIIGGILVLGAGTMLLRR